MTARLGIAFGLAVLAQAACGGRADEPPPVAEIARPAGVDPDVVAFVKKHVAAARSKPRDPAARANLALAYEANELWEEGARAWADALALRPDEPVWRYHLAVCLDNRGDKRAAIEELRRVTSSLPSLPAARYRLGELFLETENLPEARRELEETIRLVDYAPHGHVALAEVELLEGDPARAAELCRRALALDPLSKRAHYDLGLALRDLGRTAEAEEELVLGQNAGRKRYLSDPLSEQLDAYQTGYMVLLAQSSVLGAQGKSPQAAAVLERLLARHPEDVVVMNNLAAEYLLLNRAEDASKVLEKALALEPGQFATHLNLTALALQRRDGASALRHAQRAVELAPELGQARLLLGDALRMSGRVEEAYAAYGEAARLDVAAGLAHGNLGEIAMQLGKPREAVAHFEKCLRLMPGSPPALAGLAEACARTGEREKALAAFEELKKLVPAAQLRPLAQRIGAKVE